MLHSRTTVTRAKARDYIRDRRYSFDTREIRLCPVSRQGLRSRWIDSCVSLRDLQLRVLGDHFLESVRDEADREFGIVAGSFGPKNRAVTVFRVFDASAERPRPGGLFVRPGRLIRKARLFLAAAEDFHDSIHGVVTRAFVLHG